MEHWSRVLEWSTSGVENGVLEWSIGVECIGMDGVYWRAPNE